MPLLKKLGLAIIPTDVCQFFNSTMRQMIAQRKEDLESSHTVNHDHKIL